MDDIRAMAARVMAGADTLSVGRDQQEQAQAMVSANLGSTASDGIGLLLPDISVLGSSGCAEEGDGDEAEYQQDADNVGDGKKKDGSAQDFDATKQQNTFCIDGPCLSTCANAVSLLRASCQRFWM